MALFDDKAPGIMSRLMVDLGLTDFQAGGILGNIGWECAGFAHLAQIGGNAVGWIQWDGVRKQAYLAWCSQKGIAWTSDEANYGYLVEETLTSERAALNALRATTNLKDATDAFEAKDERAGAPALAGREAYARRAMAAYAAAGHPVSAPKDLPKPAQKPAPMTPGQRAAVGAGAVIAGGTAIAAQQGVSMQTLLILLFIACAVGLLCLFRVKLEAKALTLLAPKPVAPKPSPVIKKLMLGPIAPMAPAAKPFTPPPPPPLPPVKK